MPNNDLQRLRDWDRAHVWHGFTQMAEYAPFVVRRANGCVLVDIDGRRYLDGASSLWCNVHGHRHPKIDAAVRAQLNNVAHCTNLGGSNPTTIYLAKRLAELAPPGLGHVFFCSDGASAVEAALKMAFQYWRQRPDPRPEKTCFLALDRGYHGDTVGCMSVGGIDTFTAAFRPLLFETLRVPAPDSYRTPPGVDRENLCQHHLALLEEQLEKNHRRIAAMVIEPLVQSAAGVIVHPPGYLRGARELTRKYDVLLIADEVAVGFGRTGKMFACQQEEVVPDLLCVGKGLTGGYLPMSAALAADKIWEAFLGPDAERKTFFHGHTYGGNPLCAAAALASLEVFDEERTFDKLPVKIARLKKRLGRIALLPHVGSVRQRGMIGAVELVRNEAAKEPYPREEHRGQRVCDYALEKGVWIRPLGDVIVLMPPLSISVEQLDQIADAVEAGIRSATE